MIGEILEIIATVLGWETGKLINRKIYYAKYIIEEGHHIVIRKKHKEQLEESYPEAVRLKWWQWIK